MIPSLHRSEESGSKTPWKHHELWGMLAHDLRTPLYGIQGFLDLLSFTTLDVEQRGYVEVALECTENLRSTLDGILECARIESGEMSVCTQATDIRKLFASLIQQNQRQAQTKGIELKMEVPLDFPVLLSLDKSKLRQILMNLISNAVKFTLKGHVLVRAELIQGESEKLALTVTDTGIGIPPGQIQSVFGAFYQCDPKVTGYGGVGLGLAIVRKLVDTLGGTIAIESKQGFGTSVVIHLPLQ